MKVSVSPSMIVSPGVGGDSTNVAGAVASSGWSKTMRSWLRVETLAAPSAGVVVTTPSPTWSPRQISTPSVANAIARAAKTVRSNGVKRDFIISEGVRMGAVG
jgi:hypothetical protein